jgi:hypothetical protein
MARIKPEEVESADNAEKYRLENKGENLRMAQIKPEKRRGIRG